MLNSQVHSILPKKAPSELRMAAPLPSFESPREPKPFEKKAMLVAERAEQLHQELQKPGLSEERALGLERRITALTSRAEWLLGGEYETAMHNLQTELVRRFGGKKFSTVDEGKFAYRLMRGIPGLPTPEVNLILPQSFAALGLPPRMMPPLGMRGPVVRDRELESDYRWYLAGVTDAKFLFERASPLLATGGRAPLALDAAGQHSEAALLQGVLISRSIPASAERSLGQIRLVVRSKEGFERVLEAATAGTENDRAAGLRVLGDTMVRMAVIRADSRFETVFCQAAKHEDPLVRAASARGLGTLQSRESQKALQKLLRDKEPCVQAEALATAREMQITVPTALLWDMLQDSHFDVALPGVWRAGDLAARCMQRCSAGYEDKLLRLAESQEQSGEQRALGILALPVPLDVKYEERLFALLCSDTHEVAQAAAAKFAKQPASHSKREKLRTLVSDVSAKWHVRSAAIEALGPHTSPEEQKLLCGLLSAEEGTLATAAAGVLAIAERCAVRPSLIAEIERAFVEPTPLRMIGTILALGRVATHEERLLTLKALVHPFPVVRQAACEVLLRTGLDALDSSSLIQRVGHELCQQSTQGILRVDELANVGHSFLAEGGLV